MECPPSHIGIKKNIYIYFGRPEDCISINQNFRLKTNRFSTLTECNTYILEQRTKDSF
jgi:hypothetical protein